MIGSGIHPLTQRESAMKIVFLSVGILALLLGLAWPAPSAGAASVPIMVQKNLFNPERKPTSPGTENLIPERRGRGRQPNHAFQLDAIFYFGDVKAALLRVNPRILGKTAKSKKPVSPYVRVKEKDTIGSYQVVSIEPKSITLEGQGETLVVPLFQEGKVSPPAAPTPATASAAAGNQPIKKAPIKKAPPAQPSQAKRSLTDATKQLINKQLLEAAKAGSNDRHELVPPNFPGASEGVNDTLNQLKEAIESLQQPSQ